tara:strand:- start:162 stop:533 length:372 start_codon:yes stop_codon:yes gene_type:complete
MTEFLSSIRDASKSPAQQTIEAFIENKVGVFSSDIITANDACSTLKSIGSDDLMYMDYKWFTPTKVGRIMRDIPGCSKLRVRKDTDFKVWVIRGKEEYEKLTEGELYDEYQNQSKNRVVTKLR